MSQIDWGEDGTWNGMDKQRMEWNGPEWNGRWKEETDHLMTMVRKITKTQVSETTSHLARLDLNNIKFYPITNKISQRLTNISPICNNVKLKPFVFGRNENQRIYATNVKSRWISKVDQPGLKPGTQDYESAALTKLSHRSSIPTHSLEWLQK